MKIRLNMQSKIEKWASANLDSVLHFQIGMCLSLLAVFSWWFLLLPVIVGIVKEIYDLCIRLTGFAFRDTVATWLGAIPVTVILLIDKYILS